MMKRFPLGYPDNTEIVLMNYANIKMTKACAIIRSKPQMLSFIFLVSCHFRKYNFEQIRVCQQQLV
jgi:hypothetical protein